MKRRSDEEISAPLYEYDAAVRSQYGCFAGVDEAGRGPLCGPVCVAACILDPENPVFGINDSKKLTEKKREALKIISDIAELKKKLSEAVETLQEDEFEIVAIDFFPLVDNYCVKIVYMKSNGKTGSLAISDFEY